MTLINHCSPAQLTLQLQPEPKWNLKSADPSAKGWMINSEWMEQNGLNLNGTGLQNQMAPNVNVKQN